jgi:hypothetical protein
MLGRQYNREIFARHIQDADVAIVEGVMGLFNGFSGRDEFGSTAQMAKWLDHSIIWVIDARSMARSAAGVALGFSNPFRPLKGRLSPFLRLRSGQALLTLDGYPTSPVDLHSGPQGVNQNSGNFPIPPLDFWINSSLI